MFYFNLPVSSAVALATLLPNILGSPLNPRQVVCPRGVKSTRLAPCGGGGGGGNPTPPTPYTQLLVDILTTNFEGNAQATDGNWQLIDADGDGIPDLAFIGTSGTGTGTVEVHFNSGISNYQTRIWDSGSTFGLETDGTWLLVPSATGGKPDLAFIKTANTPSGKIEIHIASGASGYQTRTLDIASSFGDEIDGFWTLAHFDTDAILDLCFIKTSNTGSGFIEVFANSGASNYQTNIFAAATSIPETTAGFFSLVHQVTGSTTDLGFIRTSGSPTGNVEGMIYSRASNYQTEVFGASSEVLEGLAAEAVWSLVDYNGDGVLDLVQIVTQGSSSGTVQVVVYSGA